MKENTLNLGKMEEKELYPTIFQRKSVRKYDLDPFDEDTLKELRDHLQTLKPLHEDIKIEFKILPPMSLIEGYRDLHHTISCFFRGKRGVFKQRRVHATADGSSFLLMAWGAAGRGSLRSKKKVW